jgi:subtilisin family serine protease
MPKLKSSVIVVGALEGTGASEQIASYSTRPGILANRALMANGTTGDLSPSGSTIQGTSFAAPRVTGAAALLRHKFPNLNGEQAANILLLTASKDINNDGIADFSGASSIYGQGKLDLLQALSPVGSLAIQ